LKISSGNPVTHLADTVWSPLQKMPNTMNIISNVVASAR